MKVAPHGLQSIKLSLILYVKCVHKSAFFLQSVDILLRFLEKMMRVSSTPARGQIKCMNLNADWITSKLVPPILHTLVLIGSCVSICQYISSVFTLVHLSEKNGCWENFDENYWSTKCTHSIHN